MRFTPTAIDGAMILELEGHQDERGYFARTFCREEFAAAGIDMNIVQANISRNPKKATLRGLHYQAEPHGEDKVVQCVRGRVFDVAVDLRPASPSFCRWAGVELSPEKNRAFFIPRGCAHGFLTLEDDTDLVYLMGQPFVAGSDKGVRWNDPAFSIAWLMAPLEISERDAGYVNFHPPGTSKPL
jgi:dTDP-4-dehydrorhamnose 3,5-epimerase